MAEWNEQGDRVCPKLCEFEGCTRPQRNRGLCNAHAQQRRRGVNLFALGPRGWKSKGRQTCTFEGCDRPNYSYGLCSTHKMQQRRGVELRAIRPPRPDAEEGFRWCSRCCQFRDEAEFGWDTVRKEPKRTCKPCYADYQKEYNVTHKSAVNLRNRLKKHGLGEKQYREMVESQQGHCAICRKQRPLDIDHCHRKGHVRALLCGPCNRALGFFEDDPEIVERALEYLRANA